MKKRILFAISLLVILAMLAACAPKAVETPTAAPVQPTTAPVQPTTASEQPTAAPVEPTVAGPPSSPRSPWLFKVILPTWDRSLP